VLPLQSLMSRTRENAALRHSLRTGQLFRGAAAELQIHDGRLFGIDGGHSPDWQARAPGPKSERPACAFLIHDELVVIYS